MSCLLLRTVGLRSQTESHLSVEVGVIEIDKGERTLVWENTDDWRVGDRDEERVGLRRRKRDKGTPGQRKVQLLEVIQNQEINFSSTVLLPWVFKSSFYTLVPPIKVSWLVLYRPWKDKTCVLWVDRTHTLYSVLSRATAEEEE